MTTAEAPLFIQRRILRALSRGPLYRPALELILGLTEAESRKALTALLEQGHVEIAKDIGPATYRITAKGEEAK